HSERSEEPERSGARRSQSPKINSTSKKELTFLSNLIQFNKPTSVAADYPSPYSVASPRTAASTTHRYHHHVIPSEAHEVRVREVEEPPATSPIRR
ncbi:MAG: hypothetical protein LBF67_05215, partial [Prevotellaceae bacterium]|nr:hypothetical protein [Prevotellaceae bacterium]